jgi:hypothetical protein
MEALLKIKATDVRHPSHGSLQGPVATKVVERSGKLKWVIATRKGYYGNMIRDPEGSEAERAAFQVPVEDTATWFTPAASTKQTPAADQDIG